MAEWTPPSNSPAMTPEWAQANVIDNLTALHEEAAEEAAARAAALAATNAAVAAVAQVPSGLIGAFQSAGSIAAGWARFTSLDGRIPVGAGTTFGQTFTEGASAGSSWAHQHDGSTLTATANTTSGGSVASGAGASADVNDHTHPVSGNTANTSWIPPSFAVVWAQKS